jgi:hypothetical protein
MQGGLGVQGRRVQVKTDSELLQLIVIVIEVPINPIIKSRTHYY